MHEGVKQCRVDYMWLDLSSWHTLSDIRDLNMAKGSLLTQLQLLDDGEIFAIVDAIMAEIII